MPQAIYFEQRYQYTHKPRCRYFAIRPGLSQTSSTINVDLAGHVATCSPPNSQHTQTITWPNIEAWQHQGTQRFHDPVCSCDPSTNANGILCPVRLSLPRRKSNAFALPRHLHPTSPSSELALLHQTLSLRTWSCSTVCPLRRGRGSGSQDPATGYRLRSSPSASLPEPWRGPPGNRVKRH